MYLHDSSVVSSRIARRWNRCSPASPRVLSYSGVFIWASWSTRAAIFFARLFDELNNFHPADARRSARQGRVLPLQTGRKKSARTRFESRTLSLNSLPRVLLDSNLVPTISFWNSSRVPQSSTGGLFERGCIFQWQASFGAEGCGVIEIGLPIFSSPTPRPIPATACRNRQLKSRLRSWWTARFIAWREGDCSAGFSNSGRN